MTGTNVRAGVLLAGLRRGQVEAAERAVLGVGQRLDRPVGPATRRQRQALGVDQLDRLARPARLGQVERDRRCRAR